MWNQNQNLKAEPLRLNWFELVSGGRSDHLLVHVSRVKVERLERLTDLKPESNHGSTSGDAGVTGHAGQSADLHTIKYN